MEGEPRTTRAGALRTTRRGFLRLAGATAAFTALAQLRMVPLALAAADDGERFFDPWETEVLSQIAERMVDSGGQAPAVRDTGTVASIDLLCRGLDRAL